MGKVKIEVDIKGKGKDAEEFGKRIAKGMEDSLKRLGIGKNFSPITARGKGDGGSTEAAVTSGVVAGLAAGGIISLLKTIADVLIDFPVITAIMKLLKVILTILFLPLVPILKPAMILLAGLAKTLAPVMTGINTILTALLKPITALNEAIASMGTFVGRIIGDVLTYIGGVLSSIGKYIWNLIVGAFNYLLNIGKYIWDNILSPAFHWLDGVGAKIWAIIKAPFDTLASMIQNVVNFISGLFGKKSSSASSAGQSYDDFIDKSNKQMNSTPTFGNGNFNGPGVGGSYGDFVVTPNGTISSHPDDFIFGMKKPGGMGGSTININVNNPSVSSGQDIKKLVAAISLEMQKQVKRQNSYGSI